MPTNSCCASIPSPGTDLIIQAKEPGANRTRAVDLSLIFAEELGEAPEPYERLLERRDARRLHPVRPRGRRRGDLADRAAAARRAAPGPAVRAWIVGTRSERPNSLPDIPVGASPGWRHRCRQPARISLAPCRRPDRRPPAERAVRPRDGVAGRRRTPPDGRGTRRRWPRCSASATAPPAPACGAWSPTGNSTSDDGTYALAGALLERRQRVDEAARARRHCVAVGWHLGVGGRLAGPPVGGRSARAAQGRDGVAPRRITGRHLDPPGQSRPGPPADAARRAGPAVRALPRRRHRHPRRDREIPFQP